MSPFEVVHSHKPRKPLDFILVSPHAKLLELAKSFALKVEDSQVEIIKQIHASNTI